MTSIRLATVDDIKELANLCEQTFRQAFASDNAADDMDAYCDHHFSDEQLKKELEDPKVITLVAVVQGMLAGYVQLVLNHSHSAVDVAHPMEIKRFYIEQNYYGQGIAQQLMTAVLEEAERLRVDGIWLGVWEHNPRAIRFYEKFGFSEAGEHTFRLGEDVQRDLIMAKLITH
ncbi:GNAT family N-acetyltransferase [Pleionea sp. CnH1-48]|uniref:GNAT family N-acetyltransferase n=1 Tax=Pleionea sp. CnH1-48 TaxID=2954494 RepID=UPI0020985CF3|nr:GNAT family N-acetyltransferase [Pleionea sp. CnH1-48]MCO7223400.1 GNAT family N-acetyltransferase [Pleionea sp. CnH1-48]